MRRCLSCRSRLTSAKRCPSQRSYAWVDSTTFIRPHRVRHEVSYCTWMVIFELVIGLLLLGAILPRGANRLGVPYPALLALAGPALALIPGKPQVRRDPQLALALFVAPGLP